MTLGLPAKVKYINRKNKPERIFAWRTPEYHRKENMLIGVISENEMLELANGYIKE